MAREIKFRAWHKKDNSMVPWPVMIQSAYNTGSISFVYDVLFLHKDLYEVMQYTGEKDESGREIYEGDIVIATFARTGNMNGNHTNPYTTECEIVFEGGSFLLLNKQKHSKNSRNWEKRTMRHHELKNLRAIGHIHEKT